MIPRIVAGRHIEARVPPPLPSGCSGPYSYLELAPLKTAVACARLHTRLMLWEWTSPVLADLTDSAELLVSEIVTNAVQAADGLMGSRFAGLWTPGRPPVRFWLVRERQGVIILVWDGNDRWPVRQDTSPDDECGRGLLLVEALSQEWGCFIPNQSSGKVVWAVIATSSESAPATQHGATR